LVTMAETGQVSSRPTSLVLDRKIKAKRKEVIQDEIYNNF